jgi:hypothetical protein
MGLLNSLQKYSIMKKVRERANTEQNEKSDESKD